jgi:hypothetical protein
LSLKRVEMNSTPMSIPAPATAAASPILAARRPILRGERKRGAATSADPVVNARIRSNERPIRGQSSRKKNRPVASVMAVVSGVSRVRILRKNKGTAMAVQQVLNG